MKKPIIKLICLLAAMTMTFSFAACGDKSTPTGGTGSGGETTIPGGGDEGGSTNPGGGDEGGSTNPGGGEEGGEGGTTTDPDDGETDSGVIAEREIKAYAGTESAYLTWKHDGSKTASVYYRANGQTQWTKIDSELVRYNAAENSARADILGLSAKTTYDLKIVFSDDKQAVYSGVQVSAYDRSGYAHFGYTEGIGAYNDDGTLKSNALVIYVTEETKNTVTANLGGTTYTGIANILANTSNSKVPLNVRVIGTIGAATWNEIEYTITDGNKKLTADQVIGANGQNLPTVEGSKISQQELIADGYNTLNTSVYSELKGLTSQISYSSGEFDSYYNMCDIKNAENITVEGVGQDAMLFQWGFTWKLCNSIEVRNLTFDDYTEDACSFEGGDVTISTFNDFNSKRIWVHNNTINQGINYWDVSAEQDKHEGDGGTDFKRAAYITLSYNHYYNNHKTGLIGSDDASKTACVTFHHNFYDQCNSRLPLGRQANMHMYNNYYYGSYGTNMSLRAGAYALIENCYFENAKTPIETKLGTKTGTTDMNGAAKVYNCIVVGEGEYALNTEENNIVVVTDRTQTVANDNAFNKNFDTDSDVFYYDAVHQKSDVENMLATEDVKTVIPQIAGAGVAGTLIGGGEETPTTPEGGDEGEGDAEVPANAVTSVFIEDYASALTAELLQGSAPIYFGENGTVSTEKNSVNGAISLIGNSTSLAIKGTTFEIGDRTCSQGIQTGQPSSNAKHFVLDLSAYEGKTVTITAYATHTSGTATDGGRKVCIYSSAYDISTPDNALSSSELSMGTSSLVCLTYTITVNAENSTLYIAGSASMIFYMIGFTVA